ncbi:hypothetical protein ISR92_03340 [Patescibacteria group bacterium]|nr:hypothetical protein [Patescibacteria group bacterium]
MNGGFMNAVQVLSKKDFVEVHLEAGYKLCSAIRLWEHFPEDVLSHTSKAWIIHALEQQTIKIRPRQIFGAGR